MIVVGWWEGEKYGNRLDEQLVLDVFENFTQFRFSDSPAVFLPGCVERAIAKRGWVMNESTWTGDPGFPGEAEITANQLSEIVRRVLRGRSHEPFKGYFYFDAPQREHAAAILLLALDIRC